MPETTTTTTTNGVLDGEILPPKTSANSDVALSVANHIFAMAAAYLMAKGWDAGSIELLQGVAMSLISFGIGFWMNSGNLLDLATSTGRKILTIVLAFAAARGWISNDIAAAIASMAATVFPVVWSAVFYGKAPGPSLAGTTIVDTSPDEVAVKKTDLTVGQARKL